ncbi:hypothetical protein ABH944_002980 [Caballeronia udeis]|uniref:Uncharacterized protein n=1 Tax=Caballeronia udeis TaxID=1232866 RepID=A0ABW8MK90_9BURK
MALGDAKLSGYNAVKALEMFASIAATRKGAARREAMKRNLSNAYTSILESFPEVFDVARRGNSKKITSHGTKSKATTAHAWAVTGKQLNQSVSMFRDAHDRRITATTTKRK